MPQKFRFELLGESFDEISRGSTLHDEQKERTRSTTRRRNDESRRLHVFALFAHDRRISWTERETLEDVVRRRATPFPVERCLYIKHREKKFSTPIRDKRVSVLPPCSRISDRLQRIRFSTENKSAKWSALRWIRCWRAYSGYFWSSRTIFLAFSNDNSCPFVM